VINGRRWPPKQVLALVTGLDRVDFTTHQARRALTRLGFPAARAARSREHQAGAVRQAAPPGPAAGEASAQPRALVEALRPFIGLWVAVRGDANKCLSPRLQPRTSWPAWRSTASVRRPCSGSQTPTRQSAERPRNVFPFRALPAATAGQLTPRLVVDIAVEGLLAAPVECLLDTGALRTRMSADLAPLAGVELNDAATKELYVAGLKTVGALARVGPAVTDGTQEFSWDAPV
jgi:hypothetical protein